MCSLQNISHILVATKRITGFLFRFAFPLEKHYISDELIIEWNVYGDHILKKKQLCHAINKRNPLKCLIKMIPADSLMPCVPLRSNLRSLNVFAPPSNEENWNCDNVPHVYNVKRRQFFKA